MPASGFHHLLNYLKHPEVFQYTDGYALRSDLPGLGIEIDEAYVRKMAQVGHDWHNPVWRDSDGVIAEW